MSDSRIAPMRPSIARFLKRQIGGFVREYEREVNKDATSAKKPEPEKKDAPPSPEKPDPRA